MPFPLSDARKISTDSPSAPAPPQDHHWAAAVEACLFPGSAALVPLAPPRLRVLVVDTPDGPVRGITDVSLDLSDALGEAEPETLRLTQREWSSLRIPRVPARSNLLGALRGSGLRYALSDAGASAFCDVSSEDALKAVSKENLRNVDRLRRRAERELGFVAVDSVNDESVATTTFDRFVAVEDAGWKGASGSGTSLASNTRAQAFFREVARRFQQDGRARLDFLTIGGRDAAAQLALRAGSTWFLLKIGYNPDFKDVGPGGILLKAFLEEMVANPQIREVNLTTNPPWASRWHFQTEPVYHVFIYNNTVRGRVLYAGRSFKEVAKLARDRWQILQSRRSRPKIA